MDLTPRRRSQVVSLHEHSGESVREIGRCISLSKSTVCPVHKRHIDLGHTETLRKGHCGRKRKAPKCDDITKQCERPKENQSGFEQRFIVLAAGVSVCDSMVQKCLLEKGRAG